MEDISGEVANNGDTRWSQTQDGNDRGTNQRWGPNGGRGAITRGDAARQRESRSGIRRWDVSEPSEMTEEPESRTEGKETGKARQSGDEPEQEKQERGQTTTIESPGEEVNQEGKDPDSKSEEGAGTF